MMLNNQNTLARMAALGFTIAAISLPGSQAEAKKKKTPRDHSPLVFDASKRKKTKSKLSEKLSYSAYTSFRFQDERNLKLDDGQTDISKEVSGYLGFVARAKLSGSVLAFSHVELDMRQKSTHRTKYAMIKAFNVKEALVSFKVSETMTITAGRMRFSDAHKWVADASVDGFHLSRKSKSQAFEAAIVRDFDTNGSDYALVHSTWFSEKDHRGFYVIAERNDAQKRLHVTGYVKKAVSARFHYAIHAAGVFGDAANGRSSGFGFDTRAAYKLDLPYNPHLIFGFAAGSEGFRQTGLHSNKTYDGGQTQIHRYGYVFQPELTNLAVATIGIGLRPSRNFSMDLTAHLYAQTRASTIAPTARVRGTTTGASRFLGSELSLSGAWRPSKKTKVEFGIGAFKPGSAYVNRPTAKRVYARFSMYF